MVLDDIEELYIVLLNGLKNGTIPKGKNTSVIKLINKKTGEIYLLTNYRPILLINIDIKILTKILANRLKYVLPTIIHKSQTGVYGRKIDQTVHLTQQDIQNAIFSYVIFPRKSNKIAQKEMWKTKEKRWNKLVSIQLKSQTCKAKWLIKMASIKGCTTNLNVFTTLMETQRGGIKGIDILFLLKPYYARTLKTSSSFYREALLAMAIFIRKKGIESVNKWDTEHIFYNPLLVNDNNKPFILTKHFNDKKLFTLGQVFDENDKKT